ncbi:MAG: hypothetical protein AB8B64_00700 [Granulosicoccus sp.]
MSENVENRAKAKGRLSKIYRLLAQRTFAEERAAPYQAQLQSIRDDILDLEKEHIVLHQQFINIQSQFRETVKNQRRDLMETINRTRAKASMVRSGNMLVSNMTVGQPANSDSSSDDSSTQTDYKLCLRA